MIANLTQNTDAPISSLNQSNREAELLLCCIRYHFGTATSSEIAHLLRTELDWDYLIQKAAEHNVFLLFYQSLKQTHPELIPPSIAAPLQIQAQTRLARNLFLTKELFQILDLFATHDIQAIPFKGLIWAALVYGNMGVREFCDLDILVRPADFSKAKELLMQQGYHDKYLGAKEPENAQVQMVRQDGKVNIDLHFGLISEQFYRRLDTESFFEELQTISIAGKTVLTFSPENSVALGYLHGMKDSWGLLKRLCDFAAFIRKYPDVDWQNVMARCETTESDRNFLLAILITQTYLQIPLPEQLLEKTKQFSELSKIAEQHKQLFYRAELGAKCHLLGGLRLFPMMEMGFWGKARYCAGVALNVNERDKETFALPRFLFFVYYPLRIIRLLKTYKIGKEKLAFIWNFLSR
ncbi:nucleotidyltransferase family protein [Oscillatoria sp. HE19RPO]|uniref:nucleotidyltransferase domain-containing protein n=1 Tax=Oscillatoria sp. HE19RPO TaxID=2954806 RepID=UPI0020C53461|nr:nucleotidyltransferase family protein [Oscillatoria sp. HE19RPO]